MSALWRGSLSAGLFGGRGGWGGDLKCAALSPRLQNAFFETPWYRIIFPKLSGSINRRRRLIRLQFWLKTQIIFWLRASWSASSGRDFLAPPVPQPYKPFFAAARVLPFGSLGRAAGHFPAISRLWRAGQCACREKWAAGTGAGRGGAVRLQNTKQHRCGNLSDPAGNEAGQGRKNGILASFWHFYPTTVLGGRSDWVFLKKYSRRQKYFTKKNPI